MEVSGKFKSNFSINIYRKVCQTKNIEKMWEETGKAKKLSR